MAGRGDWGVPGQTLTLPPGAGPGQSRIVIGSPLPPPLDTYTFINDRVGFGPGRYSSGIVWFNNGILGDTTFIYACSTEYVGGPGNQADMHIGVVYNGAVREISPGIPSVLIIEGEGSSIANQKVFSGGSILAEAHAATGQLLLRTVQGADIRMSSDTETVITSINQLDIATTGTGQDINVTATDAASEINLSALNGSARIHMTAANLQLITGTIPIDIVAFADVNLRTIGASTAIDFNTGGELRIQGKRAYMTTDLVASRSTAGLTLTVASQNIAGCTTIQITTVTTNARYKVWATWDFNMTVAGGTTAIGELTVNGVLQAAQGLYEVDGVTDDRNTTGQWYSGTLAAAGVHTFTLSARISGAAGTTVAEATHTGFLLEAIESGG